MKDISLYRHLSENQLADVMTKPLDRVRLKILNEKMENFRLVVIAIKMESVENI